MNSKHWIVATLFVGALAAGATAALQQEKKEEKAAVAAGTQVDPMIAYGTPGPEHKVLASKVGKWTTKGTFHMPGAEPMTMEFTSETKWIMNDLFVEETVTGDMMGQPFLGTAITGYDNIRKKYISIWMDNAGSGILRAEGTYDAAKKTFAFVGEGPDSTMTKIAKNRSTETLVDADHISAKAYEIGADGKERLTMEFDSTRVK